MQNVSSSNSQAVNVPKLRFPGFEEEYRQINLSDIAKKITRVNPDSMAPIMMISAASGFINQSEKYSRDNAGKSLKKYTLLKKGELAYNHGASKLREFGCCFELLENEARIPYVYHTFSVINENSSYIAALLNNPLIDKQLKRLVSSSVRMDGLLNISYDEYMSIRLNIPQNTEQTKIVEFLNVINKRIEKQQALVETLKLYKRGVLNTIFSDCDNMEECLLGELCNITTGKLDANAMEENGAFRFYTCAKEFYWINTYAFDTDALLISGNGANVGYIHHYCGKFNAYQRTYVLDAFDTSNIIYVKYYLEAKLKERIDNEKKAGNTPYIVLSTLSEMHIFLPNIEKQRWCASLLTKIDDLIINEEQVLETISNIKRGLLQQMFI